MRIPTLAGKVLQRAVVMALNRSANRNLDWNPSCGSDRQLRLTGVPLVFGIKGSMRMSSK